jgi:hypothetical protein
MAGLVLVGVWALAEAVLFFVVADVPVMALAIRRGWRSGLIAALTAALLAAIGGLVTAWWAAWDPAGSRAAILAVPGISAVMMDGAAADLATDGFMAMLLGSFSGVPYKLYAHAAGVAGSGMAGFFLASVAARLPRFAIIAFVAGFAGPAMRRRMPPRLLWLVFVVAWTLFYAAYFAAHPG